MPTPTTLRRGAIASAALLATTAAMLGVAPLSSAATTAVSDTSYVLAALGATVMCSLGARRHRGRTRLAWHALAAGMAWMTAGNCVWFFYEVVRSVEVPSPSLFDVAYTLGALHLVLGVGLLLRLSLHAASALRLVLDGLLVASSLFYVVWSLVLAELHDGDAGRLLTWLYPTLDLTLASIAVLALSRGPRAARSCWLLLTGGALLLVGADTGWSYAGLEDAHQTGSLVDLLWVGGYLAIGLAALTPGARHPGAPAFADRTTTIVPYVPFALFLATAALDTRRGEDAVGTTVGVLAVTLLVMRQVLAVLENQRLARELERRVAARTQELARSEAMFRAVGSAISDAVVVLNADMRIRYTSPGLERIAGYTDEDLAGRGALHLLHRDDIPEAVRLTAELIDDPGTTRVLHCRVRRTDGSHGRAEVTMANLVDHPDIAGLLLAIRDVSEQHALQDRLRHRAEHDDLTGLVNRTALGDRLTHLLATGGRPAVVLLDLDGFKALNDSFGHAVGDELLRAVADRLRAAVRPGDLVARLGGDEFAVVVEGSTEDALRIAERIVSDLDRPTVLRGRIARCRASVGVTTDGATADELLRNADLAMYEAKATGRNRVSRFHAGMHERLLRRVRLEEALRRAVDGGELDLVYQPIVDLVDGRMLGAEALLRWFHEGEQIDPAEFVAIAEDTGEIVGIGRWVLEQACAAAASWQERLPDGPLLRVAVNVSPHQLTERDLVPHVQAALAASGLDASCLTVELTEGAVMEPGEGVTGSLTALRALGVRIAIDDFGTGYSSLARLRDVPVDEIKIDRSFVGAIAGDAGVTPVVDAVLALGRSLGVDVVAEGVERGDQRAALVRAGCPAGQGFLFGPAMTAQELASEVGNTALNFSV